ncbi:MAG: rod shape-determining protein MreC [Elusimicrobiota bacterium]
MNRRAALHVFILLTAISMTIICLNGLQSVKIIKNILLHVFFQASRGVEYPIDKINSFSERINIMLDAYDENIKLKEKVKVLEAQNILMKYRETEIQRLNELLNFEKYTAGKLLAGKILLQFPDTYFAGININKGKKHGIKKDLPVLSVHDSKWIVVGRTEEVYDDFTKVVLITSSDFRCAAEVNGKYCGVIKGQDRWELRMDYLSPDAEIREGDEITTSGKGGIFPPGLFIGDITGIKTLEFSKGKTATAKSYRYPQDISSVYLLLKED